MNWYAIHVRSQHEKAVRRELLTLRIEEFLPTYTRESRWSDRIKIVEKPLFPGYVFAHCESDRIPWIQIVRGVAHILPGVTDHEIESVRRLVALNLALTPMAFADYQQGQKVLIVRGPLRGTEGIVIRFKNRYQLVVEVKMLNRAVAVEIDAESLKPLSMANDWILRAA